MTQHTETLTVLRHAHEIASLNHFCSNINTTEIAMYKEPRYKYNDMGRLPSILLTSLCWITRILRETLADRNITPLGILQVITRVAISMHNIIRKQNDGQGEATTDRLSMNMPPMPRTVVPFYDVFCARRRRRRMVAIADLGTRECLTIIIIIRALLKLSSRRSQGRC